MIRARYIVASALLVGLFGISADVGAQMFIFPEKGQTKDQQEFDQFSCYKWAKEQTGIDPNQQAAAPAPQAPQGGQAVRGAAGGQRSAPSVERLQVILAWARRSAQPSEVARACCAAAGLRCSTNSRLKHRRPGIRPVSKPSIVRTASVLRGKDTRSAKKGRR